MRISPLEGWMVVLNDVVYSVKGCEHPLPCIHVAPKRRAGLKPDPFEPLPPIRWSRCLLGKTSMICPWDDAVLLDPIEKLEEMLDSGWRDPIVEAAYSIAPGRVGVTGSLLYGEMLGIKPRDVDLVVYGVDASRRVLEAILELWWRGLVSRRGIDEYNVVRREVSLEEWLLLSRFNPLTFEYRGHVYSVKLVSCTEPLECREPVARQPVRSKVVIEAVHGTPCVLPAMYQARLPDRSRILVYTLRSSLSCIPRGTLLKGTFILEAYSDTIRLVPDGGVIQLQMLQGI